MRYDPNDGPYLLYLYVKAVWVLIQTLAAFLFVAANFGLGYSLSKMIAELM